MFGMAIAALGLGQITTDKGRTQLSSIKAPTAIQTALKVGAANPSQVLHLTVSLPFGDEPGIKAFVDSVSDPASPNYRNFITPEEVGQRFGPSQDKVDAVVNFLRSQGMRVTSVSASRLVISAQATVQQAQAAFKTTINDYQMQDPSEAGRANFYSFATPPSVPSALAPYIQGIAGLQNYSSPKARILTPGQTRVLYSLATIYNGGYRGTGRTVAISNWDGYRLSNVAPYYTKFGLPTPTGGVGANITVKTINGGSGAGAAQGEGDLDIQMVLGMAPLCNFIIYDGGATTGASDLIDVLAQEASDNAADIISESWGWDLTTSEAASAHNVHLTMSAQGITYMGASGDDGTILGRFTYPNYDPEVLMVGGTVATTDAAGNRISEPGWSGSGGGWVNNSAPYNVRPSWQKGPGVPTTNNHRMFPDVALMAGGSGAYYFYYNGALNGSFIGTSFACPVFAGSLAIAQQKTVAEGGLPANSAGKQRLGRIQDLLYSYGGRSDIYYDVTTGRNGLLPDGTASAAKVGWDFVTGWGPPKWSALKLSTTTKTSISPSFMLVNEGIAVPSPDPIYVLIGNADSQYFSITPSTTSVGQVASASYRFQLPTNIARASVKQLDFNLTTRFATGATGQVYLYNWSTAKWDILKSYSDPATNVSTTASLKSYFTTYITAAGEYRILVRGVMPSTSGVTSNNVDTDRLTGSVTYLGG